MKGKAGTSFDINRPWVVDDRVLKKLEGSFFHAIADMKAYKQCHVFQTFIKDCYDNQRRAFTFGPDGDTQLYFGLEDVYAISRIPVDGKPVICDDIPPEELCINMLGSYKLYKNKKLQVSKVWLRDEFEKVPENPTEDVLIYHVRAYLLYLIGTKILPNSDNSGFFPVYWLQFLQDLDPKALNSVAWGAAAHCLLTSTISSDTVNGFLGPSWLYEMFFLERIPKIRKAFLAEIFDESEKDIPLHTYYSRHMVHSGNRTNNKPNLLNELKAIRFSMTDEDIVWTPYENYKEYKRQRISFSRVVLINFSQLQYHEPERAPKQLSIINLEEVGEQEQLKTIGSRGTTQRSYCKRYSKYINMWEERNLETLCIRDTNPAFTLPPEPDQQIPIVYEEDADADADAAGKACYETSSAFSSGFSDAEADEPLSVYLLKIKATSLFSQKDAAGPTMDDVGPSNQTDPCSDDETLSAYHLKIKAQRPEDETWSVTPINDDEDIHKKKKKKRSTLIKKKEAGEQKMIEKHTF